MLNIKVFGIVQGVGFRPFVSRIANANNIVGNVSNRGSYVEIFAQGSEVALKNFLKDLNESAPERSAILKVDVNRLPDKNFSDFQIIDSIHEAGDIFVSPDIAICDKCAAELFDKNNRRYLHPFINCTACGPRLTILKNMPYDRERTSMSNFPMCDACAEEYFNPDSRRYDAQPICCNDCGPEVYLLGKNLRGHEAIKHIRKILASGGIVAIKGIGGFHLACDAKNFNAVNRLRNSKTRPTKPFAVMFKNISAVERECILTAEQKIFLESPQKPIVLLQKKIGSIAENVAPDINRLGVMLPYTPLHLLIFDFPDAIKNFPDTLIMTSGNPSSVPISIDDDNALKNLECDAILSHNRKILLRADDSVMDFIDNRPSMIRRSRGYAPLPIFYDSDKKIQVLAIGGELKNTFCLAKNNLLYASPYIGDVSDLQTVEVLDNSIRRMSDLLEIKPEVIACDLHPRYQTTALAEKISAEFDIPLIKIQHHYAHILSCMAENNFHGEVIGVSFDGTGYGIDGTIWGGEFFICDEKHFERVDSIKSFMQAGGDKSAREGWRIALSLINSLDIARELNLASDAELNGQKFLLDNKLNCVESTSVGRIFDAVAAVLGICKVSTYEGEAAMRLQAAAERSTEKLRADFLTTDKIFKEILSRRLNGENIFGLARFFHDSLAEMTAQICEELSFKTKIKTVALSGGVFQNSLLCSLTTEKLRRRGLKILRHEMIPPNDGGICIGQAVHALQIF